MRIFGFDISRAPRGEPRSGNWLTSLLGSWQAESAGSGATITEDRALTISAVYTAVRIISGTMSSLPLHVMQRTDTGREFATKHWAFPLLHDSPSEYHTTSLWLTTVIAQRLLWGNSYNRIAWLENGRADAIYPLMPWEVEPFRVGAKEKIWLGDEQRGRWALPNEQVYAVQSVAGREYFAAEDILHFPGLGYDGLKGLSVVRYMADTLAKAKAMDKFTSAFFRNGAKPGAILETPGRMNEAAQKNLALSISKEFSSTENAFKVLVLEQGAKLHTFTMPLQDAQLLEGQKLTRAEIYGIYGVPPHLGGDTERQTTWGTGIAEMDVGYSKHTILPLCVGIEQEINRKLFGRGASFYAKFNLSGLERGDFKSRVEALMHATGGPFLTREEARDLEDWPLSGEPGADKLLTPLNMGVGATPAPATTPSAAPPLAEPKEPEPARARVRRKKAQPKTGALDDDPE